MQEPPRTPLPPPQPDIRDGSLASLLNNDNQLPPLATLAPMDQAQLANVMDMSLDFLDAAPLDNVMTDIGQYDWVGLINLAWLKAC